MVIRCGLRLKFPKTGLLAGRDENEVIGSGLSNRSWVRRLPPRWPTTFKHLPRQLGDYLNRQICGLLAARLGA